MTEKHRYLHGATGIKKENIIFNVWSVWWSGYRWSESSQILAYLSFFFDEHVGFVTTGPFYIGMNKIRALQFCSQVLDNLPEVDNFAVYLHSSIVCRKRRMF